MFESFADLKLEEIQDAIEKLGGTRGVRRFLKGELVLREHGDLGPKGDEFPIFKTFKFGDQEIDLVLVSVAEIIATEKKRKAIHHICNAARDKGLNLMANQASAFALAGRLVSDWPFEPEDEVHIAFAKFGAVVVDCNGYEEGHLFTYAVHKKFIFIRPRE